MARPSTLPRWATGGGAAVTEPTSGEKDVGWVDNDPAPAGWMNWLQEKTYEWLSWFEGAVDRVSDYNWFERSAQAGKFLNAIVFAGDRWIMAGQSDGVTGTIMTSLFGGRWTPRTTGLVSQNLYGLAYDEDSDLVVAVGGASYVAKSSDKGTTWATAASVPGTDQLEDVAHNGLTGAAGRFVAVGRSDGARPYVIYSDDGDTWTQATAGLTVAHDLYGVTFDDLDSQWVAVGDTDGTRSSIYVSADGITWVQRTTGLTKTASLRHVHSNGTTIVAVGFHETASAHVVTSTDGITWVEQTGPATTGAGEYLIGVFARNSFWQAVGYIGSETALYYSKDEGVTWTEGEHPYQADFLTCIAFAQETGNWVAAGQSGSADPYIISTTILPEA